MDDTTRTPGGGAADETQPLPDPTAPPATPEPSATPEPPAAAAPAARPTPATPEPAAAPAAPPTPAAPPVGAYPPGAAFGPFRSPDAPPPPKHPKPPLSVRRGVAVGVVGAALAVGLVVGGGTGWAITSLQHDGPGERSFSEADRPGRTWRGPGAPGAPDDLGDLPRRPGSDGSGDGSTDGSSDGSAGGTDDGATGTTSAQTATPASAEQQVGVVTVTSTLGHQGGTSAGTGMVLTTDGLVLTNHHVVEGATSVSVTVESTGETYEATLVGADASADVALLRLTGASGLDTVTLDDDGGVQVGDTVTAVGNAQGTGDLVAASGQVTGTDETMTAATSSGASETLGGLLAFSAAVVGGDSGGPVLDDEGEVVGMTTAASVGGRATVAYAVDVVDAVAVVRQVESGVESGGVTIGYPAFLGIGLGADTGAGAVVGGVLAGTPAQAAGLTAGDVVTAVDGTAVGSAQALSDVLATHDPGDGVTLTWTDVETGTTQQAAVTLAQGPVG